MNRRSFLQKLGLGAVIAAVAPKVIADPSQEEYCEGIIPHLSKNYPCQESPTNEQMIEWSKDIFAPVNRNAILAVPIDSIPPDMTLADIAKLWRNHGIVPFMGNNKPYLIPYSNSVHHKIEVNTICII